MLIVQQQPSPHTVGEEKPVLWPRRVNAGRLALATFLAMAAGCGSSSAPGDRLNSAGLPRTESEILSPESETFIIPLDVEKDTLKFGIIKLTDCAPLVIARELGYFDDEGLTVALEAQANWKILLDRVIGGELDGAHMLAGQPIAATIGYGTSAEIVTPYSMDRNGNAITVSKAIWAAMQEVDPNLASTAPPHPITAAALKVVADWAKAAGAPLKLAMVFPVSAHNYELRYWLAASGIHPGFYTADDTRGVIDGDVLISVTPPPQMPANMDAGTIQGFCVGEPWNQQAVVKDIGVAVITDHEIWNDNPEKVFGVTRAFAESNPRTLLAVTKALIRAGKWLDARGVDGSYVNREKACEILSRPEYVGADLDVLRNSMTGTFLYQKSDRRPVPEFNIFFDGFANYPYYSDCIWYLTQMRRWGQIADDKDDSWYAEVAAKVYRADIYREAARLLVDQGALTESEVPWDTDGYREPTSAFIDGVAYDGRQPNAYINSLKIGRKSRALTTAVGQK